MADLNRQNVVKGHLVVATLINGQNRADVFIRRPSGGGERPTPVDLTPFLNGGLSEADALDLIFSIASIGVEGAERATP